jgi:hypothetical protein
MADGVGGQIGDIHGVTQLAAPEGIDASWTCDPVLLSAQDEFQSARRAWELIAPDSERLPENASPLQFLLHARMTTSRFIYEMTKMREKAA